MAEFNSPESRNEAILQNMLGENNELLPPESRIESLLMLLLQKLGGSGDDTEIEIGYKILNKQNISIKHGSESRAKYNSYLIITQMGIVYVKVVNGVGTALIMAGYTYGELPSDSAPSLNLVGYPYEVTCTVTGQTVNIDLGYAWNVGLIIPILNDYIESVTFA